MEILITERMKSKGARWQVKLDQHVVSFRSEAEAKAFVSILQARIRAPHPWPEDQRTAG